MNLLDIAIDGVIAVMLAEALALVLHHRRTGRGLAPADAAAMLAAGLCLMAALRGAVSGSAAGVVLAWLAAAGTAHAIDLRRRWRRAARGRPPGRAPR